jgi:hypothetical protein
MGGPPLYQLDHYNKFAFNTRYQQQLHLAWPLEAGKILTVWEPPKALPTKPLESECASRFRKEAVATLIASSKVTSEGIAEEANGQQQNEALKLLAEPWVKHNDQTGIGPVRLAGLKIESASL